MSRTSRSGFSRSAIIRPALPSLAPPGREIPCFPGTLSHRFDDFVIVVDEEDGSCLGGHGLDSTSGRSLSRGSRTVRRVYSAAVDRGKYKTIDRCGAHRIYVESAAWSRQRLVGGFFTRIALPHCDCSRDPSTPPFGWRERVAPGMAPAGCDDKATRPMNLRKAASGLPRYCPGPPPRGRPPRGVPDPSVDGSPAADAGSGPPPEIGIPPKSAPAVPAVPPCPALH